MPGKTPYKAVEAYVEPLQQNVSLISKGVLRPNNRQQINLESVLHLPDPVKLNGCPNLFLAFGQRYKIIKDPQNGPFRVTTTYYSYTVETEAGHEILGYHWHPDGPSDIKFPHLHLGPGALVGRQELIDGAHFPTGRIAFEDFVKLLIDSFGARPEGGRWRGVIERTKAFFVKHKSW